MKRYLMTGMAAIMFCGVFTSCSRDTDFGVTPESKVIATYEEAFQTRFGTPAANQDWGFGPSRANTRAEGYEVGARPEANMWTSWGFLAPDPLTHAQKLRAQYYFQMNNITNPNRPNYGTKDFFMQQVYDGGTDPMAGKSLEKYLAADNSTYIESGKHMDHLTAGPGHLHINNFNNGTCSTNNEVANRTQTDVNDTNQQHSDEIMLMLNTPTSCFGYANSDASCVRDDRWTLVSAATIDAFCDGDPNFATWLASKLNEGEVDKKCDDDFHRDFIGFDFDQLPDESCYAYNGGYDKDGNFTWDNNQIVRKEFVYAQYSNLSEASNQLVYNLDGTISTYSSGSDYLMVDGFKIPYVKTDANEYCARGENANIGIGGMDNMNDYDKFGDYSETGSNDNTPYLKNLPGYQSDLKAINMKFIAKMVREGYRPIKDKQLMRWVKIGGCNDGYFSDWIVTFMPADSGDTPPGPTPDTVIEKLRVIAEDLSVGENTDFDFNDVVFDVIWTRTYSDETHTTLTSQDVQIKLLAAGGTLPLYVDGNEVHEKFGVDQHVMVNTNAEAKGLNGRDNISPVTWTVPNTNWSGNDIGAIANSIEVKVTKNGTDYLLSAVEGRIASKIGIRPIKNQAEFVWCDEREDIDHRYSLTDGTSLFTEWVQGILPTDEWYTYAKRSIDDYRAAKATAAAAQGNQQP